MKYQDPVLAFRDFLDRENLWHQKILLAVSGGLDSRVLFDVAVRVFDPQRIAVVHVDHGVRVSSVEDLAFVQQLCLEKNVVFFPFRINEVPVSNKESFWREQRQIFYSLALQKFGANLVLTAHHASDFVETVFFRLSKGSGLSAFMPFQKNTKPFFSLTKEDLLHYAQQHHLSWKHDETNDLSLYDRNLIRHEVVSVLRRINPSLEKVFLSESIVLSEISDFLDSHIDSLLKHPMSVSSFSVLHPALQKLWLRRVSESFPSFDDLSDCLRWLLGNPPGNSFKKLGNKTLRISSGIILIQD